MARLRDSWRTSLPVAQQPRNPQPESIARSPYDTVGHENQDESLCSGPFDSQKQDQNTPAACHGFFWGAGPDQLAHEQPEIVPGEPVRRKIEPSQALVISQSA